MLHYNHLPDIISLQLNSEGGKQQYVRLMLYALGTDLVYKRRNLKVYYRHIRGYFNNYWACLYSFERVFETISECSDDVLNFNKKKEKEKWTCSLN